jgi:hypothetical protein
MPPAKAFNDAIMSNYHQYRSLPKKIQDMLAFAQFMGILDAEDDLVSKSSYQQEGKMNQMIGKKVLGEKISQQRKQGPTITSKRNYQMDILRGYQKRILKRAPLFNGSPHPLLMDLHMPISLFWRAN